MNVKAVYKAALIGAMLASGISAASAQNTGRSAYDNPTRNWSSGLMGGSSYYSGSGSGFNNDPVYREQSEIHLWATPQAGDERELNNY